MAGAFMALGFYGYYAFRVFPIAMAAIVLGLASDKPVQIDDGTFIATSFPGFVEMMRGLGGTLS